ncbi:MAG: hypothetical protein ACJ712_07505 [Nitrososphaeraceae archaeon]
MKDMQRKAKAQERNNKKYNYYNNNNNNNNYDAEYVGRIRFRA